MRLRLRRRTLLRSRLDLRLRLRRQAYEQVASGRRIQDHIGRRLAFYRGLLSAAPRGFTVPPSVLAAAEIDGRYLRLRPQAPERQFMETHGKVFLGWYCKCVVCWNF